jgi:putative membrane protein
VLLTAAELGRLRDTVETAEARTDAEFVAVLARRADAYPYIPTLWAALAALMAPAVLLASPPWFDVLFVYIVQLAVFVMSAVLLRIPVLLRRVVPKSVQRRRAANLARRQFLEQGLHRTSHGMGVLIFVCELEHYVEIVADHGVAGKIANEEWQTLVDAFTAAVARGDTLAGFIACVEGCADLLARAAPATDGRNELPNHLVVLSD